MKPALSDFLDCAARWNGSHEGIGYELSWHGRSDYSPDGTWCFYIIVNSQQFYPEDWAKLRLEREDKQMFSSSWHRHFNYDKFPDLEPHGEWTFGEMDTYLGNDGKEHERVKVGCDYAHLFDREGGYWEGRSDVERNAKHSIDLLVKMFPHRKLRCEYSGRFDDADQFYTARNGKVVHKSQSDKFSAGWSAWLPKEEDAA
jgi:hypothetical protein